MRKWMCAAIIMLAFLLGGCGNEELEHNAFPLALGVEVNEKDEFQIYMAYPDLQSQQALENAMSSDVFWKGAASDLFAGVDKMSENSNKNVDFNHLKVLILDKKVFENEPRKEELISFFEENKDAAWNTYVMLTDGNLGDYFSQDTLKIGSSLGIYLDDMIEEWSNIRSRAKPTVGDLMGQYYNGNETLLIPVLGLEEKKPQVRSFAVLKRLNCVSWLTQEQTYEVMLLRNQLKAFSFSTKDGTRMALHLISASTAIGETANPRMPEEILPAVDIRIRAVVEPENQLGLSTKEKQEYITLAEQELENRLLQLADQQKEQHHFDVSDSFLLLPGHGREWWEVYKTNPDAYEKKLVYHVDVTLSLEN